MVNVLKFLKACYNTPEPEKTQAGGVMLERESDYRDAGSEFEPKHSNVGELLLQCDPLGPLETANASFLNRLLMFTCWALALPISPAALQRLRLPLCREPDSEDLEFRNPGLRT
jgi:hypothetical protein